MKKIAPGFLLPSAAYCINRKQAHRWQWLDKSPEVGDVVYGTVGYLGFHSTLENKQGRIHAVNDGSKALFVFGSRYAPDAFEGLVPAQMPNTADMLARSGMIGELACKNSTIKDPTRIEVHGYVCDRSGTVLNTRNFPLIKEPGPYDPDKPRAKMVLVVGTAMNSGKSLTAASVCWALASMGHKVRGCKVTGTASLKDILHMEDAGASPVADFTYFGYPSTYMLSEAEIVGLFDRLDRRYANNPKNYWVVELADGILQRETAMLLAHPRVRSRIHRLFFTASDAMGAIGGLEVLKRQFGLQPDAISGRCSGAPLAVRELQGHTDIPVVSNMQRDLKQLLQVAL